MGQDGEVEIDVYDTESESGAVFQFDKPKQNLPCLILTSPFGKCVFGMGFRCLNHHIQTDDRLQMACQNGKDPFIDGSEREKIQMRAGSKGCRFGYQAPPGNYRFPPCGMAKRFIFRVSVVRSIPSFLAAADTLP